MLLERLSLVGYCYPEIVNIEEAGYYDAVQLVRKSWCFKVAAEFLVRSQENGPKMLKPTALTTSKGTADSHPRRGMPGPQVSWRTKIKAPLHSCIISCLKSSDLHNNPTGNAGKL